MNYPWSWLLAQASTGNPSPTRLEQLLAWFNSNPVMGIFAVLTAAVATVAAVTGNLDKIFGFVGKYRPKKRELTQADCERLRRDLIDVVLRQVVTRQEASLHYKIPLDLKRQEERQRVGRPAVTSSTPTPDGDGFLQRRYQFQPADRLALVRMLNGVPSTTFEELLFTLQPPDGQVPGSAAAQGNRSRALLEWVESIEGPGLEKLCEVLELMGIPLPLMAEDVVEEEALTDGSTYDLLQREDIQGRLLILGEPGAGKTNELLAVAKTLLQQARTSADAPIPVIFELSEWSSEPDKTFADWLCAQLQQKYTVPLEVARGWIEHDQLWPLLDGLDELRRVDEAETATDEELDCQRQAKQIQCMRSINTFLDLHPATSAVVCCRRQEYEALEAQGEYLKRLNGAIYLQALDDEQIRTYFEVSNRGPLWDTVQNQPKLLELARSPLFLLMLVVAYQGQPIQNTDELLDLYIENQLNDLNNQEAYLPGPAPSKEQTHHHLTWLATKLEQQDVTEFLIERLQPSWLDRERDLKFYRLLFGLLFGLIVGLFLGLLFELFLGPLLELLLFGLLSRLFFGLFFGLIVGLLFGLSGGLSTDLDDIQSAEKLSFSWRKALRSRPIGELIIEPLSLLLGALLGGLVLGLLGIPIDRLLVERLLFGLLLFGLLFGLLDGLIISESKIGDKQFPNQGIKTSTKTVLLVGLLSGLLGALFFGLLGALFFGLLGALFFGPFFGLLFGLIVGLFCGLDSVIQHGCLRIVLYRVGTAPWNYAKFLEHAENHRFIQRVGGRYRFVHDLLRKRFAARYQPRYR